MTNHKGGSAKTTTATTGRCPRRAGVPDPGHRRGSPGLGDQLAGLAESRAGTRSMCTRARAVPGRLRRLDQRARRAAGPMNPVVGGGGPSAGDRSRSGCHAHHRSAAAGDGIMSSWTARHCRGTSASRRSPRASRRLCQSRPMSWRCPARQPAGCDAGSACAAQPGVDPGGDRRVPGQPHPARPGGRRPTARALSEPPARSGRAGNIRLAEAPSSSFRSRATLHRATERRTIAPSPASFWSDSRCGLKRPAAPRLPASRNGTPRAS